MRRKLAIPLICALCGVAPLSANSLLQPGPLAEIDDVAVTVMIGDSLMLEDQEVTPLFAQNDTRAAAFKRDLASTVALQLKSEGISVSGSSKNMLLLEFFGGTVAQEGCGARAYYYLQIAVGTESSAGEPERTILGVTKDEDLEATLTKATLVGVEEFLNQRK